MRFAFLVDAALGVLQPMAFGSSSRGASAPLIHGALMALENARQGTSGSSSPWACSGMRPPARYTGGWPLMRFETTRLLRRGARGCDAGPRSASGMGCPWSRLLRHTTAASGALRLQLPRKHHEIVWSGCMWPRCITGRPKGGCLRRLPHNTVLLIHASGEMVQCGLWHDGRSRLTGTHVAPPLGPQSAPARSCRRPREQASLGATKRARSRTTDATEYSQEPLAEARTGAARRCSLLI